jgi:drug/metabolite transporter (DMT)-like permease
MKQGKGRLGAAAAVAIGAGLLGFAPILMRLSDLGPQATALWRFLFALPVLAILAARSPKPDRDATASNAPALLLAGIFFGLDIAFWHASLTMTTVANATLLSNMTPIIAAIAGFVLYRQRLTRGFVIGAGVALAGATALTLARAQAGQGQTGFGGEAIALVSGVWYAAYLIMMDRYRRTIAAWPLMFVSTVAAAALALLASVFMGEPLLPHSAQGWAILLALGVVVHVGGQGFIAIGLGRLPIAISTVILWIQPVAAAALSWVLFQESLGPLALCGAALVLGGIYLVQRSRA